jgi:2,5-diketo-D-gluconate reductase A
MASQARSPKRSSRSRPTDQRPRRHEISAPSAVRRGMGHTALSRSRARLSSGAAGSAEVMTPSTTSQVPLVPLRGDVAIPQLGFGVFQVPPRDTAEVTLRALQTGYRHIDTASAYRNEAGVGQAFRASGLPREEVFITTKCFNDDHGYEQAKQALRASLDRLEMSHVDLYLIHWPVPAHDRYAETWRAFIDLQAEGLARAIGVSNFQPAHLERIIEETGVTPAVNQIELHPRFQQVGLRREHERLGIETEAWSPLAQGRVLDDPTIVDIARAHAKTAGQVVIRWHLQLGNIVFPKSVTPERIEENFDVFDFHLSAAEMEAIDALDAGERIGPDPDVFVRP